jgi:hypothetical protein
MTEPQPKPTVFSPETANFFTDLEKIRLSDKDNTRAGEKASPRGIFPHPPRPGDVVGGDHLRR